jgi:hypothetical protein
MKRESILSFKKARIPRGCFQKYYNGGLQKIKFIIIEGNLTRAAMRRSVFVLGMATTAAAFSPLPSVPLRYLGLRSPSTFFSAIR